MGRHSRPKEPTGATPIPEAPQVPQAGQAVASGSGRRRRQAPGDGPAQHHGAGTPDFGTPQVRGGHPQHPGDGPAGESPVRYGDWHGKPRAVQQNPYGGAARIPGPRRAYTEAFDGPPAHETAPTPPRDEPAAPEPGTTGKGPKGSKGRTFTGIAAAAVTTVLAVVVAGQVTSDGNKHDVGGRSAGDSERSQDGSSASRGGGRSTPQAAPAAAPYEQRMAQQFPLDPKLTASGTFDAVPGFDAAPGKGRKYRYRVEVEQGLKLDGGLFAEAVQKTLNDDRSWGHGGTMTFERISSGKPDFVITLASPGTTGAWCAKSGLDTTEDNVSCDSAATDRVMINAYRWAQGSETFGAQAMLAYRQMLINHEVGHRLGHNHVSCRTPGTLAPVMQQQTKSLDIDGIKCLPNPWVYPQG
ncbi:DUF3152 domain-containing protein [Streptomyces sp. SDr-06]|uniref:DUF3152 domain-containing protein n=1 Tax=Streptomyces sp. SDr-06 TaxID=2267702 RepID=UPI001CB8A420|nr:DUF3152 domain-containing protein [Streptomyces sp. SDr-06]